MKAGYGALLAAMALAALAATALAKEHTVGGSDGWDTFIDYDKWVAGETFLVGDTITFKYETYHNVLEVNEDDYAACAVNKPLSTHSNGSTTVELTDVGTRYFICGIPRHCRNGTMHVMITTVAAAGPASAPLPSAPADGVAASPAGQSPTGAPSSAHRYRQPAAAVAGLAVAALAALVA